jgi:ATP-dependent Lon protease
MTGEITLRGKVLPVGRHQGKGAGSPPGRAAGRILPSRNERDVEDVPAEVRGDLSLSSSRTRPRSCVMRSRRCPIYTAVA